MGDITSSNAAIFLTIPGIFGSPQQLQGFAADDIFDTDPIKVTENLMGVDGVLSSGFVFAPVPQNFALQADSQSVIVFDTWYFQNRALRQSFRAQAVITLSALGSKWALANGALEDYPPIPRAQRVLQPRRFRVIWESVLLAPV